LEKCTRVFDPENHGYSYVKDLKKVKRRGYDLNRVSMVDVTPKKLAQTYGNLVRISEYECASQDDELLLLSRYLPGLSERRNLRTVENRNWRAVARCL
jgi:RNA polymerase II subunit A small phosphatase-like protein